MAASSLRPAIVLLSLRRGLHGCVRACCSEFLTPLDRLSTSPV
jgi:hypothetical protein